MTKSVKHKRQRKQDFKKLKLKIGTKLKKAQNETKTEFKTRKITIKEQLSVKTGSLITKKQLDIKELLSRLNHSSVYVRQDGVNGLKEIVIGNSKRDIFPYISTMFQALLPCILDTDHLVRHSTVKLLESIIIKIGNLVEPFFALLTSYLSCAMVHLNAGIQSDSLALLEVFISQTPSLIAQKSNTLLNNYLSLISRKMDKNGGRTLISNPSSQLTNQKWRLKMLTNFCKYLSAILEEKKKLDLSVPLSTWQVIVIGCMPPLMKEGSSRSLIQRINILTDEKETKIFISSLVPLLFQIWSEVPASETPFSQGLCLDSGAIKILKPVAQIIVHLWKIIEIVTHTNPSKCSWFMALIEDELRKSILKGFPYCSLDVARPERTTAIGETEALTECNALNVVLASLAFLCFKNDPRENCRIASFYTDLLSESNDTTIVHLEEIVPTASKLLEDECGVSVQLRERLLSSALRVYISVPTASRSLLLNVPLVASSLSCQQLWRRGTSKALKDWVRQLVEESLVSANPEPILDVLLQFRLRNTPGFAAAMTQHRQRFADRMQVSGFKVVV